MIRIENYYDEYNYNDSDNYSMGSIDYPDEEFCSEILDDDIQDLLVHFEVDREIFGDYLTKHNIYSHITQRFITACKDDEIFEVERLLELGVLNTVHFTESNNYAQTLLFITSVCYYTPDIVTLLLEYDIYVDDYEYEEVTSELFLDIDFQKHFYILKLMLSKDMFGNIGIWLVSRLWEELISSPRQGRNDIVRLLTKYGKIDEIRENDYHKELYTSIKDQYDRRNVKILDNTFLFGIGKMIADYTV